MIITIWRHGEAGRAVTDRLRELTATGDDDIGFGCTRFHEVCEELGIPHPQWILHSPWVRTTQTADIIASAFSHATLRELEALCPGSTPLAVDKTLSALLTTETGPDHLVLVCHQPLVSQLVDYLLADPGRVPALSPGGLATVEADHISRGCARLRFWALPPGYEGQV